MKMQERFAEVLRKTEQRFDRQRQEREYNERLLGEGKLLDVNPSELVRKRLSRLQFDEGTTRAIMGEGLSFTPTAPGASYTVDSFALERVLGTNDLIGVSFLELGLAASRSVARIHVRSGGGALLAYGTGFLVSPQLLLTNNHVIENTAQAAWSRAELNFEVGGGGQIKPPVSVSLDPETFFLTDPELDYTLVAIRPDPTSAEYGWLRLIEEQGKLMVGEWVNIIQHPNGEPKQLALRENQVVDELEQFLHYRTDTAPGSSGSPVFNDQWEVVALHHSGVPVRDEQDRILTPDDRIWEPWMGEHRIAWKANEGARISRVVAHIKAQHLGPAQQALRARMFDAEPPPVPERHPPRPTLLPPTSHVPLVPRGPGGGPVFGQDGAVTWTIPLSVTVSLGDKLGPAVPPEPQAPPLSSTTPVVEDTELQDALAELAAARTRTYYDADADQAAAEEYYRGIRTNVVARTLFSRLGDLVAATHERTFSYKPSLHVYPWVDLYPDRKLRSIYSGKGFDPEELIREDFRIDRQRMQGLRGLMLREAGISQERLEMELDLLEASLPYNCEHVVPQSWFNKKEPMRGDLHHLFTCESGCNSFRSNIPYYDFPDFEEAVRDACGKRLDDDKFEPSRGKGAVARATLYFLLRYPGQVGDENRELQKDRLHMLIEWHEQFPPDEYERHRNMAIFEKQGNRNPLIDHPEWGGKIDFEQGMG
jgi:endonuclease I/V8-like Glu-specific endopeptidase